MSNIVATERWTSSTDINKHGLQGTSTLLHSKEDRTTPNGTNQREYVNAVVLDESGNALILEPQTAVEKVERWTMIEALISEHDDPLTAVQAALLNLTGYSTKRWSYIGTFLKNNHDFEGACHIFVARSAKKSADPVCQANQKLLPRWVPLKELRYGLLDGRIISFRYALNVALALLMLE